MVEEKKASKQRELAAVQHIMLQQMILPKDHPR